MSKKIKSMLTLLTLMSLAGCTLNNTSTNSSSVNGSTNVSNSESSSSKLSPSSSAPTPSSTTVASSSTPTPSSTTAASSSTPTPSSSTAAPSSTPTPSSSTITSSSSSSVAKGEWSAEIAALMETYIGEVVPYVQLDEETLEYYYYEDDYGFPIVAIFDESEVNLLSNYGDTLLDAGYELYDHYDADVYGYEIDFYTKGNVIIQYDYYPGDEDYAAGNEIYISLLELSVDPEDEYPDAWPETLINAYFNGVSVPSVPGVTNYLVSDYMDFIGFVAIECLAPSDAETTYTAALEEAGFTVAYDTSYEQYFAVEDTNSVQVDFYFYEGTFTIILSEPIVSLPAEWPADLISKYYGVSIPAPVDATISEVVDYYDYDQTIVVEVEGDETTLEAYLEVLAAANYTYELAQNTSYGVECIRAINQEQTVRLDLMLSSTSVVIEIGHYSEEVENPETPSDARVAIMEEMCMSLFGETEDSYFYDEDYGCYYTTAIFGTEFTASTTYSTLLTVLPNELCYAYSEEPIVDTYNDQDEYFNVFYDADYTVAMEVVCYYHSATYGYVAQISVYNFDDYFSA